MTRNQIAEQKEEEKAKEMEREKKAQFWANLSLEEKIGTCFLFFAAIFNFQHSFHRTQAGTTRHRQMHTSHAGDIRRVESREACEETGRRREEGSNAFRQHEEGQEG